MDRLVSIKNTIESMSKTQQIEIFKIIKANSLDYNENQNGIFINLTGLKSNIIKELEKYISFINKQNAILSKQEEIKEEYLNNSKKFYIDLNNEINNINSSFDTYSSSFISQKGFHVRISLQSKTKTLQQGPYGL